MGSVLTIGLVPVAAVAALPPVGVGPVEDGVVPVDAPDASRADGHLRQAARHVLPVHGLSHNGVGSQQHGEQQSCGSAGNKK